MSLAILTLPTYACVRQPGCLCAKWGSKI